MAQHQYLFSDVIKYKAFENLHNNKILIHTVTRNAKM